MAAMIPVEQVVKATGAPEANVRVHWPNVYAALAKYNIAGERTQAGAIATITVECPPWKPIEEWGDHPEYDTGHKAEILGNTPEADGDGQRYEGRGFIQLTGRANYKAYGDLIGVNLLGKPTLALDPKIAAEVFALYFKWKKVSTACEARDWQSARKRVNGGLNGWQRFYDVLKKLGVVA